MNRTDHHIRRRLTYRSLKHFGVTAALLCLAASGAGAADSPPDFTGIWRGMRSNGNPDYVRGWPKDAPLREDAKRQRAAYHALVDPKGETPGGWCVGTGMPGSLLESGGYPMEIIQKPDQITVIYEAHTEVRRIYISGPKAHIADEDLFATRNGHSVGHWEGDTLVVQTDHLKTQLDQTAIHSANAVITTRYHLGKTEEGKRILTAKLTMTDPDFYTEPVTVTKTWVEADPETRMMLYECTEPAWDEHLDALRAAAD